MTIQALKDKLIQQYNETQSTLLQLQGAIQGLDLAIEEQLNPTDGAPEETVEESEDEQS